MTAPHTLLKNPPRFITILLCFFPLGLLLFLLHTYAVNIPYFDEWNIIYLFERIHFHDLMFDDLWQQHNEHRIFFPKLIIIGLGLLTHYNVKYLMVANICIASLIYWIIWRHIHKNKTALHLQHKDRWLKIIYAFFIFSISQYENWFWGFQVQWFLNLAAVVLGAYLIANFTMKFTTFLLLSGCGVVATFSLSSGVLYWPILLGQLIVANIKAKPKYGFLLIGGWILLSGGVIAVYLFNYQNPPGHPSLLYCLNDPLAVLAYMAVYIGNPFTLNPKFIVMAETFLIAKWFGVSGLVLFLFFLMQDLKNRSWTEFKPLSFFYILGLYGILCALLTAIGRAEFGLEQARASRYVTVAIFVWIAIVYKLYSLRIKKTYSDSESPKIAVVYRLAILTLIITLRKRSIKGFKIVALTVIIIFFNWTGYSCIKAVQRDHLIRRHAQQAVLNENNDLNFFKFITAFPGKQMIKKDIPRLKKFKLSVFNDDISGKGRVVKINPQAFVCQGLAARTWDVPGGLGAFVDDKTGAVTVGGFRVSREAWGTGDTVNYQAGAVMNRRLPGSGCLEVDLVALGADGAYGRGSGYKVYLQFQNDEANHISLGFVHDTDAYSKQVSVMAEGLAYGKPLMGYWDSSRPAFEDAGVHHLSVTWSPTHLSWTIDNSENHRMTYAIKMDHPILSLLGAARVHGDSVTVRFQNLFIWPVNTKFRWLARLFPIEKVEHRPLLSGLGDWSVENAFMKESTDGHKRGEVAHIMEQDGLAFFSSWAENGKKTGGLISAPFIAPPHVGLFIAGYPLHPDINVYLEQIGTDQKLFFALFNPGENWREIAVTLSPKWRQTPVRIISIDNTDESQGWLGVSSPYQISWWHPFKRFARQVYHQLNRVKFSY